MDTNKKAYRSYTDESGEEYYCPIGALSNNRAVITEECVEASTAGRYSGNLAVTDRFKS